MNAAGNATAWRQFPCLLTVCERQKVVFSDSRIGGDDISTVYNATPSPPSIFATLRLNAHVIVFLILTREIHCHHGSPAPCHHLAPPGGAAGGGRGICMLFACVWWVGRHPPVSVELIGVAV